MNLRNCNEKCCDEQENFDARTTNMSVADECSLKKIENFVRNQKLNIDLLRQSYEIKKLIGSTSDYENRGINLSIECLNKLDKLNTIILSEDVSCADKLNSAYSFAAMIQDLKGSQLRDIYQIYWNLVSGIFDADMTTATLDCIAELNQSGRINVALSTISNARQFLNIRKLVDETETIKYIDYIREMVDYKILITGERELCEKLYSNILTLNAEIMFEEDMDNKSNQYEKLFSNYGKLQFISVKDILPLPVVLSNETNTCLFGNNSIADSLSELKTMIISSLSQLNQQISFNGTLISQNPFNQNKVSNLNATGSEIETVKYAALAEIKDTLKAVSSADSISELRQEVSKISNSSTITEKQKNDMFNLLNSIDAKLSYAVKTDNSDVLRKIDSLAKDILVLQTSLMRNSDANECPDTQKSETIELLRDIDAKVQLGKSDNLEVKSKIDSLAKDILILQTSLMCADSSSNVNSADRFKKQEVSEKIYSKAVAEYPVSATSNKVFLDAESKQEIAMANLNTESQLLDMSLLVIENSKNIENLLTEIKSFKNKFYEESEIMSSLSSIKNDIVSINNQLQKCNEIDNTVTEKAIQPIVNFDEITDSLSEITGSLSEIKDKLVAPKDSSLNASIEEIRTVVVQKIPELLSIDKVSKQEFENIRLELTAIKDQIQIKSIESNIDSFTSTEEEKQGLLTELVNVRERLSLIEKNLSNATNNEKNSLVLSEIASLRDRLNVDDEYDIVAEILSLREDIKANKLVDNSNLAVEMEDVRNELKDIKNDSLIGLKTELENYRNEIKTAYEEKSSRVESAMAPTNDEMNMVLSEIVSLRDEVQSYKDDMSKFFATNFAATNDAVQNAAVSHEGSTDNYNLLLDELTSLRAEIQGIKEEIIDSNNTLTMSQPNEIEATPTQSMTTAQFESLMSEITDIKNKVITKYILDQAVASVKPSFALIDNVEFIKDEIKTIQSEPDYGTINEILALREEFQSFKDSLSVEKTTTAKISEELLATVREEIAATTATDELSQLTNQMSIISQQLNELLKKNN